MNALTTIITAIAHTITGTKSDSIEWQQWLARIHGNVETVWIDAEQEIKFDEYGFVWIWGYVQSSTGEFTKIMVFETDAI